MNCLGSCRSSRSRKPKRRRSERRGCANRNDQIALRAVDVESLIGEDHPVRLIWSYVEELDLSELENRIKARGDRPGHPATSPRLLLALWLYATSEGVGSARALERLCESHDAYRWLCGGVSVNHHMLADFRVGCADLLDRLLSEHLAALAKAGLVNLETLSRMACGSGPAREPPRSGARRHSISIWPWLRQWWKTSSARSTHARTPAISAPGLPGSGPCGRPASM